MNFIDLTGIFSCLEYNSAKKKSSGIESSEIIGLLKSYYSKSIEFS